MFPRCLGKFRTPFSRFRGNVFRGRPRGPSPAPETRTEPGEPRRRELARTPRETFFTRNSGAGRARRGGEGRFGSRPRRPETQNPKPKTEDRAPAVPGNPPPVVPERPRPASGPRPRTLEISGRGDSTRRWRFSPSPRDCRREANLRRSRARNVESERRERTVSLRRRSPRRNPGENPSPASVRAPAEKKGPFSPGVPREPRGRSDRLFLFGPLVFFAEGF
jgi:hypothetical protein